jgi:hypothetical protein
VRRRNGHLKKVIEVATVGSQELRQRLKVDLLGLTALYAPELVTVHTHQLGSLTQASSAAQLTQVPQQADITDLRDNGRAALLGG